MLLLHSHAYMPEIASTQSHTVLSLEIYPNLSLSVLSC